MVATAERTYKTKDCPDCHGDGKVLGPRVYPGTGAHRPIVACRRCEGTGKVRKNPPRKRAAPKVVPPPEPRKGGREVRFVYPDGHTWDSVALVVLPDGALDACQGYDFGYGWLVWAYQGYDTIDGKPIYKIDVEETRRRFGRGA